MNLALLFIILTVLPATIAAIGYQFGVTAGKKRQGLNDIETTRRLFQELLVHSSKGPVQPFLVATANALTTTLELNPKDAIQDFATYPEFVHRMVVRF